MNIFWDSSALSVKNILDEITCNGLDGNPATFPKALTERASMAEMGVFYSENDRNLVYISSADGKKYAGIKIGTKFFELWKRLDNIIFKKNDYDGVFLYNVLGEYTRWVYEKEWIQEFISKFKGKASVVGKKGLQVHVMVQNPVSISELYGLADVLHIHPLDGILYGDRFLLPLNGYINLTDEEENTDAMREDINLAADMLGIYAKNDENYEDYLHRLQVHIFNYEIRKMEFVTDGNKIADFSYGEVQMDVDKLYELASIRGVKGESSIKDIAEEFEVSIQHSVRTKNVENIVDNLGKLYSILLARVQFGTEVDIKNDVMTQLVSYDIDKALRYGVKLVEVIDKIRKSRFEEKLNYAKYTLEKEKVRLLKSQYDKPNNEEDEEEVKVVEMTKDIEDGEIQDFIDNDGSEEGLDNLKNEKINLEEKSNE